MVSRQDKIEDTVEAIKDALNDLVEAIKDAIDLDPEQEAKIDEIKQQYQENKEWLEAAIWKDKNL